MLKSVKVGKYGPELSFHDRLVINPNKRFLAQRSQWQRRRKDGKPARRRPPPSPLP
ncbi:hypothetical protein GJ654_19955 [Rhodoblastus acidophilus]|uniref:Uncharacterized protein n=1 Tax=Rhodoblastus acidophilus TaxID=1074 RepID=A0A6N8DWK9_RHOAC|nr:hypothetical protein [Rhodoblastus acidophilus]MCW2276479.1 hypothetical protein [Rhodoblastus acidophilus]MTV33254.1 hypothetical protein [Rhodoblastus acidophilus]